VISGVSIRHAGENQHPVKFIIPMKMGIQYFSIFDSAF